MQRWCSGSDTDLGGYKEYGIVRSIGFSGHFSLLVQESHLARNSMLSGFDAILKAEFDADKDGYFYSAFFNLSIGIERLLKLAVVADHMLRHDLKAPTRSQLKAYGHDIGSLIEVCDRLAAHYRPQINIGPRLDVDKRLLDFLSRFAMSTRYFNLDELSKCESDRVAASPLYDWWEVCKDLHQEFTSGALRQREALTLMYSMDRKEILNQFTGTVDVSGHPMTMFDVLHRRQVGQKASRLAIWRMIECLRPIHFLLWDMGNLAHVREAELDLKLLVVPHFEDFFPFLLADRLTIMRRKSWLRLFNA